MFFVEPLKQDIINKAMASHKGMPVVSPALIEAVLDQHPHGSAIGLENRRNKLP